jgi:uncharacterized membrane protein
MAFCGKCGSSIADGAVFCPHCGAPVGTAGGPAVAMTAGTTGLEENIAGALCYLVGWLTGIIFLLIDKRPLVRFHAAQSIVVFGFLFLCRLVLSFGIMGNAFFGLFALISILLSIVTLVAWIALMVMTYQGKRVEIPIAAGIAKSIAGNTPV